MAHANTDASSVSITTPIYYVNDRPHIGHVYTTTLCDTWARAMRARGDDVFFLTGTDEHGVKVEKSAAARGISPQELADENAAEFKSVMELFDLTNDDFIRTTDDAHERQVQIAIARLRDSDDVYLGEFEGWYDEGQEEYHTETKAKDLEYKSPISGKPLVRATEKNYYFRLSAYQERLEQLFADNPDFVQPMARRNEVLGRLREGLMDVPVSRTNFTWGVPMPGDEQHVIYVWIDALLNYITGLGLLEPDSARAAERAKYWPASYHVIGKEILWFHAVIWPAMLMALKLPLPKCIYAHSFWVSEGQKMSKSLGNFIDLEQIKRWVDGYGMDAWRYYIITQGPLGATDADFRADHFHETYGTDLVNTVGNSCSRVTAMIGKYFDGVLPADPGGPIAADEDGTDWDAIRTDASEKYNTAIDRFDLAGAAEAALGLVRRVDGFIHVTEPFRLAKDESRRSEVAAVLVRCLEALRVASVLLQPIMPNKMAEFHAALGGDGSAVIPAGTPITKVALFPRVDPPA